MVNMAIKQLVSYGVKNNLLSEDDVIYTINPVKTTQNPAIFTNIKVTRIE